MGSLLHPDQFPDSLWLPNFTSAAHPGKKGTLQVPIELQSAYIAALHEVGVHDQATSDSEEESGIIGGVEDNEAEQHFAKRFSASLGRFQLFALDPNHKFSTTLDALIGAFAGGSVRILDVPFGAGASTLTLVSIIAELREKGQLERRPLEVHITGGDLSEKSLKIGHMLLSKIKPWWERQNIAAHFALSKWDVLDSDSTTDLTDQWLTGDPATDRYVFAGGNFSGFLGATVVEGGAERWMHRASSQLKHIITRGAKRHLHVFWVEPQIKQAKKHFLPFLSQEVIGTTKRLTPLFQGTREDDSMMGSCLVPDDVFVTRAAGIQFKRTEPT